MWLTFYIVGGIFGSAILLLMLNTWGLSLKQIGIYILLSWLSDTFFGIARDLRREDKAERVATVNTQHQRVIQQ